MHEITLPLLTNLEGQRLIVDGLLDFAEVDIALCKELRRLAPYGQGNPEPVFAAPHVLVENVRPVGRNHLALQLRSGTYRLSAIGFGMLQQQPPVGKSVDIAFVPTIDEYQNQQVRLRLIDIQPSRD
jgi:single-stranded-DNA-specific exonuclease